MRRSAMVAIATLIAVVATMVPGSAAAAAPTPAWTIQAIPYPTAFEAGSVYDSEEKGPAYLIQAFNVGGAATSGEFTLTDSLPKGLLPAPGFLPSGLSGRQMAPELRGVHPVSCSVLGRKITCVGGGEGPVGPGESVGVVLPVKVEASAAGTLEDKAAIEGGGAPPTATTQPTTISTEASPFGFLAQPAGLYGFADQADGSAATQAGSHPYAMTVAGFNLATDPNDGPTLLAAGGGLHEAVVTLPHGAVVDPAATPRCKESELEAGVGGCPDASQVGTVSLALSLTVGFGRGFSTVALYNMVPPPGYPAELGFEVVGGTYVHYLGSVSSDGTFTLTAASRDVLARVAIGGVRTTLWGVPSDGSHEQQRGECLYSSLATSCPVPPSGRPFLSMPSSCGGPLTTKAKLDSWDAPGAFIEGGYQSTDLEGNPVGVDGCGALEFGPTLEARSTTDQGDSPAGLHFALHQPQHEGGEEPATADLKNVTVKLPEGMSVNPSAANGLEGCSTTQIGLVSPIGSAPARFAEEPAHCPNASKIGEAEAIVPLLVDEPEPGHQLAHPLKGSVYLSKPFDNPFGSLLGLYLVIEDEGLGVIAKLAGRVEADPATGQLTTTFAENPELPLEDVKLDLFKGARASLTSPLSCGTHTTTTTLVPWSTPEGADTHPSDSFQTTGSCSASEAAAPKSYGFEAGTVSPLSGSYSPLVLKLTRPDGAQHLAGLDLTLPPGLTGKAAGIPYCPEAGIARAQARSNPEEGKLEQADPSCPKASEVGTVTVGAGSGPAPIYVTGHVYWAGPYKGAPLSVVVVTPAVAGPFDLGVVVVRVALQVNLETAQIHAVSDPLPTILDGIPLDLRSVSLNLDRQDFTLNPTSCEAKAIEGQVTTQAGQSAALNNRFQVGECGRLAFKPKIAISLKGQTKRTGHPALKATVTYPEGGGYANIAAAQVALPHAEFLDQGNLNKTCTRPVIQAGACPASSVYGKVKLWTPLLEAPLEGNVYLVGGYGYKLPALVAELNGQVRLLLVGKVDTGKNKGIRTTFEAAPDAPFSRFVLEMKGGKKYGLLENSENVCRKKQKAQASFTAQNGKAEQVAVKLANNCRKTKHKKKHGKHGKKHGKAGKSGTRGR